MTDRSPREAMCALLASAFNEVELRQFFAYLPLSGLAHRLPGDGASLSHLAFEATLLLEREDLIAHALDRLRRDRPGRASAVDVVRGLYGVADAPTATAAPAPAPATVSPPARRRTLRDIVADLADYALLQTLEREHFLVRDVRSGAVFEAVVEWVDPPRRKLAWERARLLRGLDHPSITRTVDVIEVNDRLIVIREPALGRSLGDLMLSAPEKPVFATQTLCTVFARIADALAEAHRSGLVHGGLTPDHIFVDGGRVRVTFDLLHAVGTPSYQAPEASGDDDARYHLDGRYDLYSLAVILFEAATGHRPHPRGGVAVVASSIKTLTAPSPRQYGAVVPPEVDEVCRRCIRPDPEQRPSTAAEVAAILRRPEQPGFWHRLFAPHRPRRP